MRKAGCYLLLACAAAFGQAPPETAAPGTPAQNPTALDANAERAKALAEAFRSRLDRMNLVNPPGGSQIRLQGAPVFKPSVCAIPLLNVVPPGTKDRMTVVQPPNPVREDGGTVKVPAPACDEHLFTNGPSVTPVPVLPAEPPAPGAVPK
jgi:hypothetical protein